MNRLSKVVCLTLVMLPVCTWRSATAQEVKPANDRIIGVETRQNIHVAYDIKDNLLDAGIGKGLYYVRGLLESYKAVKVAPAQRHISVVLHGEAAYMLLNDEAYQEHTLDPFSANPNDQVVTELLDQGVSVEICYQTMKGKGWTAGDILPGVTIVHDAYTRLIDLQQRDYAYIRF